MEDDLETMLAAAKMEKSVYLLVVSKDAAIIVESRVTKLAIVRTLRRTKEDLEKTKQIRTRLSVIIAMRKDTS